MVKILKDYIENHVELLRLDATEKTLKIIGVSVPLLIMTIMGSFFIILLNIGLALMIGKWIDSYALGFFILSGFYLLIMILAYFFRNNIKDAITDKAIEAFLMIKIL
jgi:hypothetical protein